MEPEAGPGLARTAELPPLHAADGGAIEPRRLLALDGSHGLALLDDRRPNTLFCADIETGSVVREWRNEAPLRGLALFGGKDAPGVELLAVSRQEILQFDTRTRRGIVDSHFYRTNYSFRCTLGLPRGHVVVAFDNGDLRLYARISGNAKNVLPAKRPDMVRSMDCSRDGALVLIATSTRVLLLQELHHGISVFTRTFLCNDKPQPLVLEVCAETMRRAGLDRLNFHSAHFDERRTAVERYIVAATGEFLVLWELEEVLRGRRTATQIYRAGEQLLGGEFCFDRDELLVAGASGLFVQSMQRVPFPAEEP